MGRSGAAAASCQAGWTATHRGPAQHPQSILTGIFYVLRSGCQWRMLPRRFGPWSTVYAYYRAWRIAGAWERIHTTLEEQVRRQAGRESTPSAAILDSQSVETTERGGPHGYDGAKKLSGRKRHLLVDTLGMEFGVFVHPADIQDRASAPWLLRLLQPTLPRLELIWADSAYLGPLQTWVWETLGWRLRIVERPGGRGGWMRADQEPPTRLPGFQPAPHRWIVERTLSWLNRFRRLKARYERRADIHEAFLCLGCALVCWKQLEEALPHGAHHQTADLRPPVPSAYRPAR